MPLTKLVKSKADKEERIVELAQSKLPEIQSIAIELYNSPARRNDDLVNWFITAGYKGTIAETGNEPLARANWEQIARWASLKVDELALVPIEQRKDLWMIAMSIIIAASKRQAEIESGLVTESFKLGTEAADDLIRDTKGISKQTLKDSPFLIKQEINGRKEAKKVAAKQSAKENKDNGNKNRP